MGEKRGRREGEKREKRGRREGEKREKRGRREGEKEMSGRGKREVEIEINEKT